MKSPYNHVTVVVVGWCPPSNIDADASNEAVDRAFSMVSNKFPATQYTLVSGLTDVGVHSYAYRAAEARHWGLHGVAAGQAYNFAIYPVQKAITAGYHFGDDAEFDALIEHVVELGIPIVVLNFAGGKGAERIVEALGSLGAFTYSYALPVLKEIANEH